MRGQLSIAMKDVRREDLSIFTGLGGKAGGQGEIEDVKNER